MDNNRKKAAEAIRKIASNRAKKSIVPALEKKADLTLNELGVAPQDAKKAAITMKVLHDLSQGKMEYDDGSFSLGAELTPKEKRLRLGYKKSF